MTDSTQAESPTSFYILAVDGGGYRGIFAAHILARMEQEWKLKWKKQFGLAAGTSTGSILVAGLALDFSAADLLEFYREHGPSIFNPRRKLPRSLQQLISSRYSSATLRRLLQEKFSDHELGEISWPIILPAVDISNGCVHVFKSHYDPGFVRDTRVRVSDAVLSSCSAPTYFDPHHLDDTYLLADGGLWANNPALVAAVDAHRRLSVPLSDLRVLSIGTGRSNSFYPRPASSLVKRIGRRLGWGLVTGWEKTRLLELILNLQSDSASNMLNLLLGQQRVLRLTFDSDRPLPMDATERHQDWLARADHCITHQAQAIREFLGLDQ